MLLLFYKFMKFMFRYLVPAPLLYPLARSIAHGICRFNARRRTVIVENLTPLVGREKAARLAPELMGNFLMTAVDFFCIPPAKRQFVMEGWSRVEATYHRTRRVMIVTAHIGNWETGIWEVVDKGYPVGGIL